MAQAYARCARAAATAAPTRSPPPDAVAPRTTSSSRLALGHDDRVRPRASCAQHARVPSPSPRSPDTPVAVAADDVVLLDFADEQIIVLTRFATTRASGLLRAQEGFDLSGP